MALYHFHVSRVLRSRGQSSVESAAYRAGERLEDRYYGKIADYTAKGGVICSEILAPDYVPSLFIIESICGMRWKKSKSTQSSVCI